MKSIFDNANSKEILDRINKLRSDSTPQWGKMNVSQMMAHAAIPIEAALGIREIPGKGNFILKLFFKSILYNDKPYSKSSPTNKLFIVTDQRNFDFEKNNLVEVIQKAVKKGNNDSWGLHPTFGAMTSEQWGQSFYKHLDHHLKQFGV
jgi:hypothetical protein